MSEFREALKRFVKDEQPEWIFLAQVTSVADDDPSVNCTDVDGNEYLQVRLQPQLLGGSGTFVVPKLDSWVLVGSIQGKDEHAVLQVGDIDRIEIRTGNTTTILKTDGLVLKNQTEDLAGLMVDFIDAQSDLIGQIKLLTVTCAAPGSPSTPPINLAAFTALDSALTALKTRFNSLLKTS